MDIMLEEASAGTALGQHSNNLSQHNTNLNQHNSNLNQHPGQDQSNSSSSCSAGIISDFNFLSNLVNEYNTPPEYYQLSWNGSICGNAVFTKG